MREAISMVMWMLFTENKICIDKKIPSIYLHKNYKPTHHWYSLQND